MIQLTEEEVYQCAANMMVRLQTVFAPKERTELDESELEELRILTEELNSVLKAKEAVKCTPSPS